MDTQNTPVHFGFWHRNFWMMAFANLFLMMSAYMMIPSLPSFLIMQGYSSLQAGEVMGAYGVGIFALGGFCSYLVQRYRRNRVCQISMLAVACSFLLLYYLDFVLSVRMEFWMIVLARFLHGAFLGLAHMTLSSTLVIDTCESFQRTEANYTVSWFARLALATGPLLSVFLFRHFDSQGVFLAASGCSLAALLLVSLVKFPFKAPSDNISVFCLDRFFLPQGILLFVNIILITVVVGILFSVQHAATHYVMLLMGFFAAMLAERYAFANADLKSEIITGLFALAAAILVYFAHQDLAVRIISPVLTGFGTGIIGSRFLLFYIKLAKHCQRGTSQSSFFLSWEFGLSLGLFLGIGLFHTVSTETCFLDAPVLDRQVLLACLSLIAVSLLFYNFCVHPWYVSHKNR